jgi:hypothetical protein
MGFDPPQLGEVHEVSIELEGPVGEVAFRKFEQELKKCIKDHLGGVQDADHGNAKLKVKKRKAETKPKP